MTRRIGRLRRRSEFLRVTAGGKKCAAPGLVLQTRPTSEPAQHLDQPADLWLGITVSRRVGNAVRRNRARRRLREAARIVLPTRALSGHDYVLIGRSETLTRHFADLVTDLEHALRRLGVADASA